MMHWGSKMKLPGQMPIRHSGSARGSLAESILLNAVGGACFFTHLAFGRGLRLGLLKHLEPF